MSTPNPTPTPCAQCETCHHGLPEGSMAAHVACIAAQAQMIAGAATDLTVRLAEQDWSVRAEWKRAEKGGQADG